MNTLFPINPSHGMIYEQQNGIIYQFDATIRSWIELSSESANLPLATSLQDGAMSNVDLRKLNRLLIPYPVSSIIGTDCNKAFDQGMINLYSGDKFIKVNGNLSVQNLDQYGESISKEIPYQIHQHTYGFDFSLDTKELLLELESKSQVNLVGKQGKKGDTGETGDPGINGILSGPPGDQGDPGTAPECILSIEPETIQTQIRQGLKKALVNVAVVPDPLDERNYSLQFDRQVVGNIDGYATQLNIQPVESTWVLAIALLSDADADNECGIPGERNNKFYQLYYIDIEPIISTVYNKYKDEVSRLKKGYQDIVAFWVQRMSDLFDEQKNALCCALEKCISGTKSISTREHMESLAATTLGKAKIRLNNRNSSEAVKLSSTKLLNELGGPDLCENVATSSSRNSIEDISKLASADSLPILVEIDPLLNSALSNSKRIELPAGEYVITVKSVAAQVNGLHRGNIKIRYTHDGEAKTAQILDKGSFSVLLDAQMAYEGLTLSFKHDGGDIQIYLPSIQPRESSGHIIVELSHSQLNTINTEETKIQKPTRKAVKPRKTTQINCEIAADALAKYEEAWKTGKCCGIVVELAGQDYIIVKRSLGSDESCGGGESYSNQCIAQFDALLGHPAFAWPTFDGVNFAHMPKTGMIRFMYDKALHDKVRSKIVSSDYQLGKSLSPSLQITDQISVILFPSA